MRGGIIASLTMTHGFPHNIHYLVPWGFRHSLYFFTDLLERKFFVKELLHFNSYLYFLSVCVEMASWQTNNYFVRWLKIIMGLQ